MRCWGRYRVDTRTCIEFTKVLTRATEDAGLLLLITKARSTLYGGTLKAPFAGNPKRFVQQQLYTHIRRCIDTRESGASIYSRGEYDLGQLHKTAQPIMRALFRGALRERSKKAMRISRSSWLLAVHIAQRWRRPLFVLTRRNSAPAQKDRDFLSRYWISSGKNQRVPGKKAYTLKSILL